jgi:uncharacterized LabA/DUF88 family protein
MKVVAPFVGYAGIQSVLNLNLIIYNLERFLMYKAIVFIDEWNITSAIKTLGYRMDWEKLQALVEAELDLIYGEETVSVIDWFVYAGIHPSDRTGMLDERRRKLNFLDAIKDLGYLVIVREGTATSDTSFKANIDVMMAVDAIAISKEINPDIVVLFTGDSDFAYVARKLRKSGINVVSMSTSSSMSEELRLSSNDCVNIEEYIQTTFPAFKE